MGRVRDLDAVPDYFLEIDLLTDLTNLDEGRPRQDVRQDAWRRKEDAAQLSLAINLFIILYLLEEWSAIDHSFIS